MPACNLLPSLRKFTARHIWTLTAETHFTNNATLNYISGLKLVVTMISRFEYCVSCIFHLHSCKKFSHILISLCKVVFLLFQFSVRLRIFARGCICTVWIFCVFVYFCARVTETSRRQTGRDVEVKRARDIFTSARSWLPTALQDLPYKDNQDEENESCKDKCSLKTRSIDEIIACDPNTFAFFVCNFIVKEKYWELMNGQRALDILDWPVIVIRPPRWHFNGRSEENNGSRAAQLPAWETDAMHHISCISFKTLLKAQWIKPWVLKVQKN